MKVEIDLDDLENLKKQIRSLTQEKKELETELKMLDEKALKSKAVDLARKMYGGVMLRVYEQLGFKDITGMGQVDFIELEDRLGDKWYESEKLNVTLGATIIGDFRGAFMTMGIKTKDL